MLQGVLTADPTLVAYLRRGSLALDGSGAAPPELLRKVRQALVKYSRDYSDDAPPEAAGRVPHPEPEGSPGKSRAHEPASHSGTRDARVGNDAASSSSAPSESGRSDGSSSGSGSDSGSESESGSSGSSSGAADARDGADREDGASEGSDSTPTSPAHLQVALQSWQTYRSRLQDVLHELLARTGQAAPK